MSEDMMPDVFDISPEETADIDASMDPSIKVPDIAKIATDKHGEVYKRWSEPMIIEAVEMSRSPKGHTCFYIESKIRAGGPEPLNVGRKVFTRYFVNFPALTGKTKDQGMKDWSIRSMASLASLLKATGYAPKNSGDGLKADLLRHMFPVDGMVTTSPLIGQVVVGQVCDAPNKGEGATSPRQSKVEKWFPGVKES